MFANAAAFADPNSRKLATGADLNPKTAITDAHGHVLAYAQTGGMMDPRRHELRAGTTLYRFGGKGRSPQQVASGGWWVEKAEFEKLLAFANAHDIALGLAMRILCLVPPEWSDAILLVRARAARDLLSWRGLANSVVTPAAAGGGMVRLPHQNEIAARRLHQLFIPGLNAPGLAAAVAIENDYPLDPDGALRGFLYL